MNQDELERNHLVQPTEFDGERVKLAIIEHLGSNEALKDGFIFGLEYMRVMSHHNRLVIQSFKDADPKRDKAAFSAWKALKERFNASGLAADRQGSSSSEIPNVVDELTLSTKEVKRMIEMMCQQGITSYRLGSETLVATTTEDGKQNEWWDAYSKDKFAPDHQVLFNSRNIGDRYTKENTVSFDFAQGVSFALSLPTQLGSKIEDPTLFMKEIAEKIKGA